MSKGNILFLARDYDRKNSCYLVLIKFLRDRGYNVIEPRGAFKTHKMLWRGPEKVRLVILDHVFFGGFDLSWNFKKIKEMTSYEKTIKNRKDDLVLKEWIKFIKVTTFCRNIVLYGMYSLDWMDNDQLCAEYGVLGYLRESSIVPSLELTSRSVYELLKSL